MRQNEPTAALREVSVYITDTAGEPVTGLTGATINTAKPGANLVSSSATLTEVTGGAEGGGYRLRLTTGEVDTPGELQYEISHASIDTVYGQVTIEAPLRSDDVGATLRTYLWQYAFEGSTTVEQALRGLMAALVNKSSGYDTSTRRFRDIADTKNRITATVDATGRIAVTLDLS